MGRPTFTLWLARPAEHARAGRTGAPASATKQVDFVVAKIQRVRAAGAGFAERRIERAQDRVPGERYLALFLLADEPDGNRAHRQRHDQHVRQLELHSQRILANEVFQFRRMVELGGFDAAAFLLRGWRLGRPPGGALLKLGQQSAVIGFHPLAIARQAAIRALLDERDAPAHFGFGGAGGQRIERAQFGGRHGKGRIVLQVVAHGTQQALRLFGERARRAVQANAGVTDGALVGLHGVLKREQVIRHGRGIVFHQTPDPVLDNQFAIQDGIGVDTPRGRAHAQARATHRGRWRQQRTEALQPFSRIVRAAARAEIERQPVAHGQLGGDFGRHQRAHDAFAFALAFALYQRAAAHEQVARPIAPLNPVTPKNPRSGQAAWEAAAGRGPAHNSSRHTSKSRWNSASSNSFTLACSALAASSRCPNSSKTCSTSPDWRAESHRSITNSAKSRASSRLPRMASISPTTSSNILTLSCRTRSRCSSTVPAWQKLNMNTSCSWPMRWTRPTRCSSRMGFHGRSKLITVSANCRLRPSPPAPVESSTSASSRKRAMAASLSPRERSPLKSEYRILRRRQISAKCSKVGTNSVKTTVFALRPASISPSWMPFDPSPTREATSRIDSSSDTLRRSGRSRSERRRTIERCKACGLLPAWRCIQSSAMTPDCLPVR